MKPDSLQSKRPGTPGASYRSSPIQRDHPLSAYEVAVLKRKLRAETYRADGQDIPALFARYDKDQSGTISRDEIVQLLKRIGAKGKQVILTPLYSKRSQFPFLSFNFHFFFHSISSICQIISLSLSLFALFN